MEITLGVIFLAAFFGVCAVYGTYFYKEKEYKNNIEAQKHLIQDMVNLLQVRTNSINNELNKYIQWLNKDFTQETIELFLTDSAMEDLKKKHKIKDTDFIMSFKGIIASVQNLQKIKVQELLEDVSSNVINEVKRQLGEK